MANSVFLNEKLDNFLSDNLNNSNENIKKNFEAFAQRISKFIKDTHIIKSEESIKIDFSDRSYIECWEDEENDVYVSHNVNGFEEMIDLQGGNNEK